MSDAIELVCSENQSAGEARKGHRFEALDGLRAIAITLVLIAHLRTGFDGNTYIQKLFLRITEIGWVGVDLFFVLSGFLITGILLDSKPVRDRHPWAAYFRPFYGRRLLRIFPLYYAYLFIVFCLLGPLYKARGYGNPVANDNPWWPILYWTNWLPVGGPHFSGLWHLWSLSIEEQFYLFWPLLIYFSKASRLLWTCIAMIVAAPFLRLVFAMGDASSFTIVRSTLCRVDSLCWGALIALAMRDQRIESILRRNITWLGALSGIALVGIILRTHSLLWDSRPMAVLGLTFTATAAAWTVCFSLTRARSNRVLTSRPLKGVAKYSYGIYVLHPLIALFFTRRLHSIFSGTMLGGLLTLLCLALLSVGAAMLSWLVMEEPLLRLKSLFPYGERT